MCRYTSYTFLGVLETPMQFIFVASLSNIRCSYHLWLLIIIKSGKKKLISLFLPYIIPPPNIDSSNLSFVRIYAQGVYKKVIKQGLSRSNNGNPVCVSGDKKYSFFGKFGVLCFVEALVLRFALLPYNRRYASILAFMQKTTIQLWTITVYSELQISSFVFSGCCWST